MKIKRNQSPSQLANLRPITRENAREFSKKSNEKKRENARKIKLFKEILDEKLAEENKDKQTIKDLLTEVLIKQAYKGNLKAIEMIRDTIGEKPAEKIETVEKVKIKKVFVTQEMRTEAEQMIDDFING